MDIGHITRCPRIDRIRSATRSIGTVIGLFSPGDRFPSGVAHLACRRGRKCESPRKGAFAHEERRSSWAMDSCLSRFCGSSVVSNNVPVLGIVFRGLRPQQDVGDPLCGMAVPYPVPGKAERLDPPATPRMDGEPSEERMSHAAE
jgi:hypothetical protein